LPVGDRTFLLDEKLLSPWCANEFTLWAKRQGHSIVVFSLFLLHDLKSHGDTQELPSVCAGCLPSGAHGHDTGLVERNVAQRLTLTGETELVLFLALFFRHDVPL
jgi:hypothetical protein